MEARLSLVVFLSLFVASMVHGSFAQTTHVVGDALGWTVPPGGEVAYRTWAATRTFTVGDVLVFNFTTNQHTVGEVSKESFESCNSTSTISLSTDGPTNITLTSPGEHHFICTVGRHCVLGQKLAINVSAASAAPAPQPTTPPTPSAPEPAMPTTPPPSPSTYTVGDNLGWLVPPGGPVAYQTWATGKTFSVGDTLVFNFTTGAHNVLRVTRSEFDSCTISTTTTPPTTTNPARISLTSAGEHYYICTFPQHCSLGQKLAINVTAGGAAPTPTSGGSTPTPSTPTPVTPPPPPSNAAPSTLPAFTLVAVALAFLYN